MKKIILFLALGISTFQLLQAQYFNNMTDAQRDSTLIAKAKEVVFKYAKDYYRDYGKPVIGFEVVSEKSVNKENWGRGFYRIKFPYDTLKEAFRHEDWSVWVTIWSDTGNPMTVFVGNGTGRGFLENEPNEGPPLTYSVQPPHWIAREALARRRDSVQRVVQEGWERADKERRRIDSVSRRHLDSLSKVQRK